MMLFNYFLQVSISFGLFYAFYHFLLQGERNFHLNRLYLLGSVIFAILVPFVKLRVGYEFDTVLLSSNDDFIHKLTFEREVRRSQSVFSLSSLVGFLYLGGILWMAFRFFRKTLHLYFLRRSGSLMVIQGQRCVISDQIATPFSFLQLVYLPAHHSYSETELSAILRHEHVHVLKMHSLDIIFIELVSIVFWGCPFIYLYQRKIKELHEFMADAEVVRNGPWEEYVELLIRHKSHCISHQLSSFFSYSPIKTRIKMMTQHPKGRFTWFRYAGILPMIFSILFVMACREQKNQVAVFENGMPSLKHLSVDTLVLTEDRTFTINHRLISNEKLESALVASSRKNSEQIVLLQAPQTIKIGVVGEIMERAMKFDVRLIMITP